MTSVMVRIGGRRGLEKLFLANIRKVCYVAGY